MIMKEPTKSQMKHLRSLANRAYDAEISAALDDLYEKFQKWKANEITSWALSDEIHKYHNETARELCKIYEMSRSPELNVAYAVAKGILKIEEVEESCRPLIESKIDLLAQLSVIGHNRDREPL
jgi:benzoyl-CoA reductase/2-hydroxyglutaryl-CoA dehydratase subunit BcrC/BadD/HgdB